jgi:ribose 5-phosphate isomerase B
MDTSIIIGADHGGFELKEALKKYLLNQGYQIKDVGSFSSDSVDYPDFAYQVSEKIADGSYTKGIVVCTSGIGVSIVANKSKGVRAALCTSEEHARLSRLHNDANVLALGSKFTSFELAKRICDIWLNTAFEGGRHEKRIKKISDCEG